MDPRYSVVGLAVGFLIGLTGMGGGSLMTPILILLLHFKPTMAVGSDMVYSSVTKIVGGYQHHRQKTVNYALSWRLAAGSVPGGLLGVYWVHSLQLKLGKESEHLLLRMLGIMLIVVAVALFIKSSRRAEGFRLQV